MGARVRPKLKKPTRKETFSPCFCPKKLGGAGGGEFLGTPYCLTIFAVFFVSRDLGEMLTQYLATLDRYMIVHELVEKFTSSF